MKKFLAGLAMFAGLAMSAGLVSPAFALDNHVAWEGFLTVTASSAGCAGVTGSQVGDVMKSTYRAGLTPSELSALNIIYIRGAINLTNVNESANSQLRGSGTATFRVMNARALSYNYTGNYLNIVTTPAKVLAGSPYVTITGILNNLWTISAAT